MVKICLTASAVVSSIFLSGCREDQKLPVKYFYSPVMRTKLVTLDGGQTLRVVDLGKSFCTRYELIEPTEVVFDSGKKLPLLECNGMFGTNSTETPVLMDFIRDQLKKKLNSEGGLDE